MIQSARSRGFTLIELLVVIAIIGLLSSIVLASLTTARARASDAAIRSNLNNARAQAELYFYANNNSYASVCTPGAAAGGVQGVNALVLAAAQASGLTSVSVGSNSATLAICNATATGWASQVPLEVTASTWYCVDSTGVAATLSARGITTTVDVTCS